MDPGKTLKSTVFLNKQPILVNWEAKRKNMVYGYNGTKVSAIWLEQECQTKTCLHFVDPQKYVAS